MTEITIKMSIQQLKELNEVLWGAVHFYTNHSDVPDVEIDVINQFLPYFAEAVSVYSPPETLNFLADNPFGDFSDVDA